MKMLVQEKISDTLIKTYSDAGFLIKQVETGIEYGEAVDVLPLRYTYVETDKPIPKDESETLDKNDRKDLNN